MLLEYFKRGSYHTFFLGITSVFSRVVSFLFLPYFLSKLTLAEFGVWDFYQHFFSLGTMLVSSGAATALTRFYIFYNDEPLKQKQVIGNACMVVIALAILLLAVSPSLLLFLHNHNIGAQYFFVSVVLTCLFSLFSLLLAYLRVSEQLWKYAAVFCAQSFLATILTVIGLTHDAGIMSFFYAHCCSLLFFLPLFFNLVVRHCHYSWSLFKEQFWYSIPLLVYNIIYMGFFSIDRFFLKATAGYEALGAYALLWRFGALYQFFSMSLANAAPIVIFNAQKEKNGTQLLQKLLTYACMVLIIGGLVSIYATRFALNQWFFKDFHAVTEYIPFFFMFLCLMEISRFMQTGFHLATKTIYIPILACIALGIQGIFLLLLSSYGVVGICCANTCTFITYAALSYSIGYTVYPHHIIDYKRVVLVLAAFLCSILAIVATSVTSIFLLISWATLIWFGILTLDEKQWLKKWLWIQHNTRNIIDSPPDIIVQAHHYSNNITGKHIALLGPYPPPLGGISVHIKRVGTKLQQQQNIVSYFDTIKRPPLFIHYLVKLLKFLYTEKSDTVYYHTPYSYCGAYEFCFLILLQKLLSFELILVEHDARYFKELTHWQQRLLAWCIQRVSSVVFIGNTTYLCYATNSILPQHFTIEAAFLPPDLADKQKIIASYPQTLFTFIDKHYPIILANAFQLRLLEGIDVYGYDMCLELLWRLKKTYPFSGLIFALAHIGNKEYYLSMQSYANKLEIADHIFILHNQKELWPLYTYADVFVRPTSTDNYGISVAEALFFNIPAIASDVCVRPKGTIVCTAHNIDEFYDNTVHVLGSTHKNKRGDGCEKRTSQTKNI